MITRTIKPFKSENMNRLKTLNVIAIFAFTLAFSCNGPVTHLPQEFEVATDHAAAGFDHQRLARIDSVLTHYIETGKIPNAATFVSRNGKIVHHKAYGYQDIENAVPLSTGNIFRIASQTKAITTAALMTLYDEGKFLLDEPVSRYIPWFTNHEVLTSFNPSDTTWTTRPASGEITVRQLLNHTSGIHYGILGDGPGNMMYTRAGIPAVNSMDSITNEEVVRRIASMPLLFDPGERYYYGMNTDVAGYLIEVLSGKTLEQFISERILEPLGMNDTWFYLPEGEADRLVTLYSGTDEGPVIHPNATYRNYPVSGAGMWYSGGAGLSGTIEDYARFCQMLLNKGKFNGNRILSRKTVELMTINQIGELEYGNFGRRFGLGFDLWSDKTPARSLGSEGSFKWGGMYYTDYLIDPAEQMVIIFYTNIQPYRGPNLHDRFRNMVYQALE